MKSKNQKEDNSNQIPTDILLKINFIGDSKCGKTSLIKSLLYSKYFESSNDTVMSIYHIDLDKIDNFNVSLNIFELGSDLYENSFLTSSNYVDTNIFVICFELKENFDKNSIEKWLNKIDALKESEKRFKDVYLVLCKFDELIYDRKEIGSLKNNMDLNEDILRTINMKNLIKEFDLYKKKKSMIRINGCFYTSALLCYNTNEFFQFMIKNSLKNYLEYNENYKK